VPQLLVIAAVVSLEAASCGHPAPAASAQPVNSLTVKACTVDGMAARCGTLIVPEDRLTGQGQTIPVRFVVIPATGRTRRRTRWSISPAARVTRRWITSPARCRSWGP
jgi:hypothetical protein